MNSNFEGFDYYIHIIDDQVVEQALNADSSYQNGTLYLKSKDKMNICVVHEINTEVASINYEVEKNSTVEIYETRIAHCDSKVSRVMDVKDNANVAMLSINESESNIEILENVTLRRDSHMEAAYGELSYTDVHSTLNYELVDEGAYASIRNAVLSSEGNKKHFEVSLIHSSKHTYGQMFNYGVVKDASHLVFDGIGKINRGMSGSESHQTSKIMVFDEGCLAKANPYLYIDEYDVKASHAAGVGKMDEEHLFYLQSRGLSKNQSMKLITYGYLMPVVDVISNQLVKDKFSEVLGKRMGD